MKQFKERIVFKQSGFSLIELLICMAILSVLMTAVISSFISTTQQSAQQSTIAETQIETDVGLDLFRADLEHAGFGLPWQWPVAPNPYSEPDPMKEVGSIPKAFNSRDDSADSLNASDYLVIRAANVIRGVSGQKWGTVGRDKNHNIVVRSMSDVPFANNDRVIALRPEISPGQYRQLVMKGTQYTVKIKTQSAPLPQFSLDDQDFAPSATPNDPDGENYLVYGLDDADVRRPFNRTDYYLSNSSPPAHCAQNTGVLVKATVNQANDLFSSMPIVDCVADFQVVYYLDTNGDGGWDTRANSSDLSGLTAKEIREQVKVVRCYILAHEGGGDRTFTFSGDKIKVGDIDTADGTTFLTTADGSPAGREFDLKGTIKGNWANYRWKVYSLAVTPKNLF